MEEGWALHNLGKVSFDLGQNEQALKYLKQALSIRKEVGNRKSQGRTLICLGQVCYILGKREEALIYYEQALSIQKEVRDRKGEGRVLTNMGQFYGSLGKKEQMWKYYAEGLSILKEVGDPWEEGKVLQDIGKFYFGQCRYDNALAFFLLARNIFEKIQSIDRDGVQRWIDYLSKELGEEQFTVLLAQIETQASQIVNRALQDGLH